MGFHCMYCLVAALQGAYRPGHAPPLDHKLALLRIIDRLHYAANKYIREVEQLLFVDKLRREQEKNLPMRRMRRDEEHQLPRGLGIIPKYDARTDAARTYGWHATWRDDQ